MPDDGSPKPKPEEDLLPGWRHLELITPRRPVKPPAPGRRTWALTYVDPDKRPGSPPVTESTGHATQRAALEAARLKNTFLRKLIAKIEAKLHIPIYQREAHLEVGHQARKLIKQAVRESANTKVSDVTARHTNNDGGHFALYAEAQNVHYFDQITEELLKGWLRTVILTPCSMGPHSGKAKWHATVDAHARCLKAFLRNHLQFAPQLNSDIIRRALPRFATPKDQPHKGQDALVQFLLNPSHDQRRFVLARTHGEPLTAADDDDDRGRVLSQLTLRALLRAAIRRDIAALRKRGRNARLISVDITLLLVTGLRRDEYGYMLLTDILLGRAEPMDRRTRTDLLLVREGKARRGRWVPLTGYTRIGIEIVRELHACGGKTLTLLGEYGSRTFSKISKQMRADFGAPTYIIKDFRSTGANFAQRLHHIPLETRAERWGHTMKIHTGNYVTLTGAALRPAGTIEEAMDTVVLMKRVLRLVQFRNGLGAPAREKRRRKGVVHRERLLPKVPSLPAVTAAQLPIEEAPRAESAPGIRRARVQRAVAHPASTVESSAS